MPHPNQFDLPLTSGGAPLGYGWQEHDLSSVSDTTAFKAGLDQRDIFLGEPRCVVCGVARNTLACYVIPASENKTVSRNSVFTTLKPISVRSGTSSKMSSGSLKG